MDQSPNSNHPDPVKSDDNRRTGSVSCRVEDQHPAANAAGSPTPPPLTPAAWLANNAFYLVLIAAIIGIIWYKLGLEGLWSASKVVVGIGIVIFIHELGHFLAAKWCDVHVQTFSIGFGPALPGCSFQRGETTYKLAVLPLGGYVNMIGEGLEAEEDENYPRSFKNKTVGQRMLIISAGVIMNVLLGCVLFIVVYYYHGIFEKPAVVGSVDVAGAMWTKGIPTGALVTKLDGVSNPTFKTLQRKVILSAKGEELPFTFETFDDKGNLTEERTVDLLPRLDANDPNPVVGVSPVQQLRLPPKPDKELGLLPVIKDSPAVAARPIPVNKDEIVVATTDPDNPESTKEIKHDPKTGSFDYHELSRRVLALRDKRMVVRVIVNGAEGQDKPIEREVPLEGFQWNDTIIGCTAVQGSGSYNPFRVSELARDPRHKTGDQRDPFVFRNRLRQLIDLPIVVQVRRGDPDDKSLRELPAEGPVVNLFLPAAHHFTFGMRMKMGKVAGIRDGSPAARAGVQKGDELIKVVMIGENGEKLYPNDPQGDLDPQRLPFELIRAAAKKTGKKRVILTLRRESERAAKEITTNPVEWEEIWDNDREEALGLASPLAVPQLGVAYWVLSQIVEVQSGSPAAKAGLKKDDTIKECRLRELSEFSYELGWEKWRDLESKRNDHVVYDRWAMTFSLVQLHDFKEMQVKIKRPDEDVKEPITLTPVEDSTWPMISRGLKLMPDLQLKKADNLGDALVLGGRETRDWIVLMYLQLRSLATGRVPVKQLGGPIEIGMQGFLHAQTGNFELLLFLGIISINLAVVNFLPIPILDGGHMVFLIYEKLRGRPPTEKARVIASYLGLAVIGFLMLFVFYQDIQKYVLQMFGS